MKFYATCPTGLEQLLGQELESLGTQRVRPLIGQVAFEGVMRDAYRVCMWSRLASSVVAVIASFECHGADELFEGASQIDWTQHIAPTSTFAVQTNGTMEGIANSMYASQRVKDAVADCMLAKLGTRPNVDTKRPDVRIRLRLREGHASVGIDLSGEPLFRRGYDQAQLRAKVPALRPDYAAALLRLCDWESVARESFPSIGVAFAGAGTLAVEAAGIALDAAPGLSRTRWGFSAWLGHSERTWNTVRNEAQKRADDGRDRPLTVVCSDTRLGFATSTQGTLRSAGLPVEPVFLPGREVSALGSELAEHALVVIDLSWLHADEAPREAEALSFVTNLAASLPQGTSAAAISHDNTLDALFDEEPEIAETVTMAKNEAVLAVYADGSVEAPATVTLKDGSTVPVLVPATDQFAARLEKDFKERSKWCAEEDVTCYRVYDQDLPDYNVALDLYQGADETPGTWLVAAEYAAPKEIDPEIARRRLIDVLTVAPRVLGVRSSDVALRVRKPGKGGSQYAAPADITRSIKRGEDAAIERKRRGRGTGKPRVRKIGGVELPAGARLVNEGGLTFEVNFEDHIDTGLFLDHRDVRNEIREMAKRMKGAKRFLNLFAYTGTGTVYAADGGAAYTTTVDLSWTYIDWARRNMERNGFVNPQPTEDVPEPEPVHEYVKADVLEWIDEQRKTRNRWDLVYCDPPTFSNSSDMRDGSFEVQRDHAELLIGISRLLTAEGVCLFSCNLRSFSPDVEKLDRAGVIIEDVTEGTIPHDFERNSKIHHVYLVRRKPMSEQKRREIEERRRRGDHGRTLAPDSVRRREGFGRGPRRDGGFKRDDHRGPRRDGDKPGFKRDGGFKRDDHRGPRRDGDKPGFKRDDHRGPKREGFKHDDRPRRDGDKPRRDFRRDGDKPGFKRDDHRGPRRDGDKPRGGFKGGKPGFKGGKPGGFKGGDHRGPAGQNRKGQGYKGTQRRNNGGKH